MKTAIIQHCFHNGLGDFLVDFTHYTDVAHFLKAQNYEIHLKLVLDGCKYVSFPFLHHIFDQESLSVFNSIEEGAPKAFKQSSYNNVPYFGSVAEPQQSGYHHYDLFLSESPFNFDKWNHNYYCAHSVLHKKNIPLNRPLFSQKVLSVLNDLKQSIPNNCNTFLHLRVSDDADQTNKRYNILIKHVQKYLEETKECVYLGTNNPYLFNTLKMEQNIFCFQFKHLDVVDNQLNSFVNKATQKTLITDEMLIERLIETLCEMLVIKEFNKIIHSYDISWLSNFLFPALVNAAFENKIIEVLDKRDWLPRRFQDLPRV